MLAITTDASFAIRGIVQAAELPEDSGLRITAEPTADGEAALSLSIVAAPEAADQVVEGEGTQVFLEPVAADVLDDKVLDAEVTGTQVSFTVAPQEPSGPLLGSNSSGPE